MLADRDWKGNNSEIISGKGVMTWGPDIRSTVLGRMCACARSACPVLLCLHENTALQILTLWGLPSLHAGGGRRPEEGEILVGRPFLI